MAGVSGGTASTDGTVGSGGSGQPGGTVQADGTDQSDEVTAHRDPGVGAAGPRARLLALAGLPVLGSEGDTVGRVRDIYLHDATGELSAVSVVRRQLSSRHVVIPSAAIAELPAAETDESPQSIRLLIPAETARTGIRPPQTAHLTPELLREAHQVLGLEESATA